MRRAGGDTEPPSPPAGLTAISVIAGSASLRGQAAADDAGVVGYDVLRDSAVVASAAGTSAIVTGLPVNS